MSDLHELDKTDWFASNTTRKICQAKGKDEVCKHSLVLFVLRVNALIKHADSFLFFFSWNTSRSSNLESKRSKQMNRSCCYGRPLPKYRLTNMPFIQNPRSALQIRVNNKQTPRHSGFTGQVQPHTVESKLSELESAPTTDTSVECVRTKCCLTRCSFRQWYSCLSHTEDTKQVVVLDI